MNNNSKEIWDYVKNEMRTEDITLSPKLSSTVRQSTAGLLHILARYKFVTKMLTNKSRISVLDLGCNDGLGDLMIRQNCDCRSIVGLDFDEEAVDWANANISDDVLSFKCVDFFENGGYLGENSVDCVVSLDVIEHIPLEQESDFLSVICRNLKREGMTIIGTPNVTMYPYASPWNKKAHINNYDQSRLYGLLDRYFENVFIFGMTDEVLHTGFYPFACYIMALACGKRN